MTDTIRYFLTRCGPNPKVTRTVDKYEEGTVLYRVTVDYLFKLDPPLETQLAKRYPDTFQGGHIHKSQDGAKTVVEAVFKFPVMRQKTLWDLENEQ